MHAVILAAGAGRRLWPLTAYRPKPMLPVAARPIIGHVIETARVAGVDAITLVVGYKGDRIRDYVGDGARFDVPVSYVDQQHQLGTAHALAQAADAVDDVFLVLNGDQIVEASAIASVIAAADQETPAMAVTSVDDPIAYGVVTVTDGWVTNRRAFDVRTELEEPAEAVADDFPASTTSLNTQLRLTVDYRTEPINGKVYTGTLNVTPSLESNNDAYWLTGDQRVNVSKTQTRVIEPAPSVDEGGGQQTAPSGPVRGEPNMQLVALLAILGVIAVASGGAIGAKAPQLDQEELRKEIAHNQYSEWISEGELLLDSDNEFVYVNSIEDLVNVGIDANKRVIYDPDLAVYTVSDGDVTYYYTTEPADLQRWAHL